eukprot:CAMPEP_0202881436 /NCGR_PEP_ID=MMETSP1391-20130828/36536_1 /ASSEMBLY_ACC=CAM_ASM_000867 /TAXON_ID=1034604 /ORGANISM="Chlamydomonas leiostraca, Strain SAG 11-49" /LENGTH=79 /DNA_ID=CAMNT_0049564125 /DNA_START=186 /DNA_END=421 /DNA_ORIENTATION=+
MAPSPAATISTDGVAGRRELKLHSQCHMLACSCLQHLRRDRERHRAHALWGCDRAGGAPTMHRHLGPDLQQGGSCCRSG